MFGGVTEWSKVLAWKASVPFSRYRGFESLPLRRLFRSPFRPVRPAPVFRLEGGISKMGPSFALPLVLSPPPYDS